MRGNVDEILLTPTDSEKDEVRNIEDSPSLKPGSLNSSRAEPLLGIVSHYVDTNLTAVRISIWTSMIIGLALIFNSLGGHIKYTRAEDIPAAEYERRSKFRGVVVSASLRQLAPLEALDSINDSSQISNGSLSADASGVSQHVVPVLWVEHTPWAWRLVGAMRRIVRGPSLAMPTEIDTPRYGVAVAPLGFEPQVAGGTLQWLQENLVNRTVTVNLLAPHNFIDDEISGNHKPVITSMPDTKLPEIKVAPNPTKRFVRAPPTCAIASVTYAPKGWFSVLRPRKNVSFELLNNGFGTAVNTVPVTYNASADANTSNFVSECISHEILAQKHERGMWATPHSPTYMENLLSAAAAAQGSVKEALARPAMWSRFKALLRR